MRLQVEDGSASYACNGLDGMDGADGASGLTGPAGARGPIGPQGDPGLPGTTGQDIFEVVGTAQLQVAPGLTSYTLIPGLIQSVNAPANTVVYVFTNGGIQSTGSTGSTCSVVDVGVILDTASTPSVARRVSIANSSVLAQLIGNWSMSRAFTNLSPATTPSRWAR